MASLTKLITGMLPSKGTSVVMFRHGESLGNLAGTLTGWTDVRLTEYGRRQANYLYSELYPVLPKVKTIFSSDLARAVETVRYATLWTETFETDERLREIYLGKDEGEHYDSMPPERQAVFNEMAYHAPEGESWTMVQTRAKQFIKERCTAQGLYLVFCHGGLICTLTHPFGDKELLSGCSAVGFAVEAGEMTEMKFKWTCPEIQTR